MTRNRLAAFSIGAACLVVLALAGAWYVVFVKHWHVRAAVTALISDKPRASEYADTFKLVLAKNAGINDTDPDIEIARKLTNHLYQSTLFSGTFVDTTNDPLRYTLTVDHKMSNLCSSLSDTLVWALDLFNIKARQVNLAARSFFENIEGDTHSLTEVMIDSRPVVFDPTFDTTYSCGSKTLVDAKMMFDCVKNGEAITGSYIGTPRAGRKLDEYYIPLSNLFYAIEATRGENDGFYQYESPYRGWLIHESSKYRTAG